jgi:hypothetical protein
MMVTVMMMMMVVVVMMTMMMMMMRMMAGASLKMQGAVGVSKLESARREWLSTQRDRGDRSKEEDHYDQHQDHDWKGC